MRRHHTKLEVAAIVARSVGDLAELSSRGLSGVGLHGDRVEPSKVLHDRVKVGGKIHRDIHAGLSHLVITESPNPLLMRCIGV